MPFQKVTRRVVVLSLAGFAATPLMAETTAELIAQKKLSVEDAHDLALEGAITLVDIRRPDEWALTGVGVGAKPLDMRRKDFVAQLDGLVGGDRSQPIAVMCARGVRSKWLSRQLEIAGFTQIIDVPEGMLGSRAGPGWLRTGLPVVK
ncbi:rhodanese-like domain-containing protein [Amylibacter sp. IMCC11727]|uniref:rhodanese-like domain-containing protein n=1 Tax=Amylibacter sp. IMCC11727 TaxID=3039851 RepID=UPI00244E54AA|nr:rhodanese-like domain-containing protein [Amylibacter sp. IMCC11727]WGI23243.1 rhodanese-like domain-containing protein [Amylibacter sp. IMCC11727]